MNFTKVEFRAGSEILVGQIFADDEEHKPQILFIHGAGQGTKDNIIPLANRLLEHGISSFGFDFSGHGESTGRLQDSSLRKRVTEAQVALKFLGSETPITICAFSMGGHIALELLKKNDIANLILFSPAIYTPEAFDVPFNEEFSDIIRRQDSWKHAEVVDSLEHFTGKFLVFVGQKDEVIPNGVIEILARKANRASLKQIVWVPNVGHRLVESLYKDEKLFNSVIEKILEFLQ